ncbi:FmdB family zinc ribbon protein [Leifsonia sp. A12D58]|uniref:FmdB family zinc ribbon protein n=1 Tax=Leifsonia sp. A12D58 TaxID=3397674 RepID=UPI0039DFA48D
MPTYSYRCTECDTAFDIHQAFSDDSLTVCPTCHGKLRKVFSAVGVTFNGSGFYRNDSRDTTKSSSAPSPAKSASTAAASTPAKESKPAVSAGSSSSSSSSSPSSSTSAAAS